MKVGRIVRTADFERVLAQPPCARSAHFALHHLAAGPSAPGPKAAKQSHTELSTDRSPTWPQPVDESPPVEVPASSPGWWLGMVCPKRHARRAVTRNLLKRQMRAAMQRQAASLPHGLWVVRLKAPFDADDFPSPASAPLRASARDELSALLERATRRRTPPPAMAGGRTR